jgi:uncharacterized membrane protein
MRSRVRALGHPVHPMLVMFPVALFITGTLFDVIHLFSDNGVFAEVGFWSVTAGLVGAVLAALTGFTDWTKIPNRTRAKSVGVRHGLLNSFVLLVFLVCWALRLDATDHAPSGAIVVAELIAVGVAGVAAWLGGELVDRLSIGVDEDAQPNATSSLTRLSR